MEVARGPDAVRSALVEAAIDLYAATGDAPVRSVAKRAGVNHGLVHHYLGGKAGLRAAVLDRVVRSVYADLDVPEDASLSEVGRAALRRTQRDPRFVKILARTLLRDPDELEQSEFPVVNRLRAASTLDADRTDEAIAQGLAMGLGALVFGPWIRRALRMSNEAFDAAIERGLERTYAEGD